jgi:hypothetical protein
MDECLEIGIITAGALEKFQIRAVRLVVNLRLSEDEESFCARPERLTDGFARTFDADSVTEELADTNGEF